MSFLQKITVCLVIILGAAGLVAVDTAYSEMMNEEPVLALTVRRVDDEHVRFGVFGFCETVNTKGLQEGWQDFRQWTDGVWESVSERFSST